MNCYKVIIIFKYHPDKETEQCQCYRKIPQASFRHNIPALCSKGID